jgi:hypothetical protein
LHRESERILCQTDSKGNCDVTAGQQHGPRGAERTATGQSECGNMVKHNVTDMAANYRKVQILLFVFLALQLILVVFLQPGSGL